MTEQLTDRARGYLRALVDNPGCGAHFEVRAVADALRVVDAQDARIAELEAEREGWQKSADFSLKQWAAANVAAEALAAEWQQSARDAQVEVAELRTKVDTQTARIAELEVGAVTAGNVTAAYLERALLAESELAELRTQVDSLAQRHLSRDDQLAASEARVAELSEELRIVHDGYVTRNGELAQLRERVAKAVEELQKWPHNSGLAVVDAALEALRG